MTLTSLVIGAQAASREASIAACIEPDVSTAVILEGLAPGVSHLEPFVARGVQIIRIAPGCMCCVGNLTLKVHLNRLLRKAPSRLFIALATPTHLDQIRNFLTREPYDALLTLTVNIDADLTK
jgi:G3E family GTPase